MAGKLSLFLAPMAELMGRLVAALVQGLRRFLLRLLGGVPTEVLQQKTAAALAERPRVELTRAPARRGREVESPAPAPRQVVQVVQVPPPPPRPKAEEERWSDRVVRQCLERVSDGQQPFPHLLRRLPAEVAVWLKTMSTEEAADLARSHGDRIKATYEAWKNPPPPAPEAEAEAEPEVEAEPRPLGPRPRF
ncbi:MAG TPA: hypothetical protein VD978_07765 [Azospirillum sp.]|nr:hypothetical protein [Azospirillum sp.]